MSKRRNKITSREMIERALTVAEKALVGADAEGARFDPRYDLVVPGIQITYRWTGEYDGRAVKVRHVEQAGDCDDYRRVSLVYDLEGSRTVFIRQDIESEAYPADWTAAPGKAALIKLVPSLASIPDADWTVVSCTRAGSVNAYANRLLSGSVPEWTGKHTESDVFTVRIYYVSKATDTENVIERGEKIFNFRCVSTDAATDTYKKQTEWVEAEPVPAGLAAALMASWNRLHYDGQVTFHQRMALFDLAPGMLLSCTGGLTEWASMAAVIQDVTVDLATGTTAVRTGTCGRLQADNLLAVYRAARGRRFSQRRLGRDNGDGTDGNQIAGPDKTPNDNGSDGTPPCLRHRLGIECAGIEEGEFHIVDINPEMIVFGPGQTSSSQIISLRETLLPYEDAGEVKFYRGQILCGELYGEPVTLPAPEAGEDGEDGTQFQTATHDGIELDNATTPPTLKLVGTNQTAPPYGSVWGYGYIGGTLQYGWLPVVTISLG